MKPFHGVVLLVIAASQAAVAQTDTTGSGSVTISLSDQPAQVSAYIGISATGGVTAACPSGKIVLGIGGTRLKFIQKLTPICGTLNKDGSIASSAPLDPAAIAADARGFKLNCGPGRVAVKARVSYHDNTETYPFLGGIEVSCAAWLLSQWSGALTAFATTGFDSWPRKGVAACTWGSQPVRAVRVRGTTSIKAVSIVCDEP